MYIGLLHLLSRHRPATLLIDLPHIAMSMEAFEGKNKEEVLSLVRGITAQHDIDHFCVAAHSYGCIWAGWVMQGLQERVKQAVLLEPVCLLLFLPVSTYTTMS